jgi:hypothetical protein
MKLVKVGSTYVNPDRIIMLRKEINEYDKDTQGHYTVVYSWDLCLGVQTSYCQL